MTKTTAETCRERAAAARDKADAACDYPTLLIYDTLAQEWLRLATLLERGYGAPEPINLHVGEQLRRRRREMGLTPGALGDLCGVPAQHILNYETGATPISAAVLWRLSQGLNRPVEFFYPQGATPGRDA